MKKIKEYLLKHRKKLLAIEDKASNDKAFHFTWMFFFQISALVLVGIFYPDIAFATILLTPVLAHSKEWFDKNIKGSKYDWADVKATVYGGVAALIIYLPIYWIIK